MLILKLELVGGTRPAGWLDVFLPPPRPKEASSPGESGASLALVPASPQE